MTKLAGCQFCGDRYPELALAGHAEHCESTPLRQAELRLHVLWTIAALRDASESAPYVGVSLLAAIDDAAGRIEASGPEYDWGLASDVLDEHVSELSAKEIDNLFVEGADLIDSLGADLPNELVGDAARAPNQTRVLFGFSKLIADRLGISTTSLSTESSAPDSLPSRRTRGWTSRLWLHKQIVPGVRLNLSKSGPSLTLGPRGGHVTYGPSGTTETISIPGTGARIQRHTPKGD